ncbi:hypothetical protein BRC95_01245 [Halobacteriales archaeon QS_5_68_33]|nr:MAG: hypothetical protein BRC95_01245 [Halobacteriales archaeon QS_5_68_33]
MDERRRRVLRATGLALATGLAGCGGDGDANTDGEPGDGEAGDTPSPTGTASPTATEPDDSTPTATDGGGNSTTPTPAPTESGADPTPTPTPGGAVDLVIESEGFSAWVLAEDESGEVAPTDESNPTMTFGVGTRYAVENNGWDTHPFALRAADDSPLLSQSADGSYEDDDAVDWVDDGGTFAFTMTDDLAADLNHYICTVHSSMRGEAEAN